MMGWYGNRAFLGGGFDFFGLFYIVFSIFVLVDLILLAFWLWKQLKKK
jgi:hypothetical protein